MILGTGTGMNLNLLGEGLSYSLVKAGFVLGLFIYGLFALVILKQTKVMEQTIDGKYNQAVNTFAWLHLVMAILLFAMSIFYL